MMREGFDHDQKEGQDYGVPCRGCFYAGDHAAGGGCASGTGKGWALASFAGLNLGWGKISDGVMKNHYPKGLRRG